LSEVLPVPDLSQVNINLAGSEISQILNAALERAAATKARAPRLYLGASIAGDPCARRVQLDWFRTPFLPARVQLIFDRGHAFERLMRERLTAIGFLFAPPEAEKFTAFGGLVEGHADGVITYAPSLPSLQTPAVWECKALNNKNWRAIARDGLELAFPKYSTQVLLYQHYLGKQNPALYTAINADTCEHLHFPVPYDVARAQRAIERVETIIAATRKGELLLRAYDSPDDWRCQSCSQREFCWR
jgi:hypothetical protein